MTDTLLRLVAVDLGAESGRAVVGTFDGGRLALKDAHRFPNVPVTLAGTLHWDFLRLFGDVVAGLRKAAAEGPVVSVGVDTWGVDFGLLDERGRLLGNPVHYRDARTVGMVEAACEVVPREEIYRATGIQFMPINTLYQLLSMARSDDPMLRRADRLLMTGDLFAHFLCGSSVAEYTNASTSQCLDPFARDWARPLLERLGIPTGLLPEIVQPGTVLGTLLPDLAEATGLAGTRVVAPGSHDTASAVVGAPLDGADDGVPLVGDLVADRARGRVARRVRRQPRREPDQRGGRGGHDPPAAQRHGPVAGPGEPPRPVAWWRRALVRRRWPRSPRRRPPSPPSSTPTTSGSCARATCPRACAPTARDTGQPAPEDTGDADARAAREPRAAVRAGGRRAGGRLGHPVEAIHVVGGGTNNKLLCRLTAGATGLPVRAGPVEATAIGNVAVQAIAAGELASIAEARDLIARSFPVATYEPEGDWAEARARFASIVGRSPAPTPAS